MTGRGTSPRSDGCDGVCVNLGCSEDCGEPDQSGRVPSEWHGPLEADQEAFLAEVQAFQSGRTPSPPNLADRRRITAPEHVWAAHGHPGEVCESLSPERPFLCALRAEKEADHG